MSKTKILTARVPLQTYFETHQRASDMSLNVSDYILSVLEGVGDSRQKHLFNSGGNTNEEFGTTQQAINQQKELKVIVAKDKELIEDLLTIVCEYVTREKLEDICGVDHKLAKRMERHLAREIGRDDQEPAKKRMLRLFKEENERVGNYSE